MIRIGIAGLGFMGTTHYRAYQQIRGVKVCAMHDIDRQRLGGDWTGIQGNFGPRGTQTDLTGIDRHERLDAMLADPSLDLIDVCLPTRLHPQAAIAALRAGRHVFCEKPIAIGPVDARRMIDAAGQAGRQLLIGQVLPFFPEYDFAYRAITSGKYGRLLGGHFRRMIADPLWLPDFYNPKTAGGPMLDLHVHDAHFIRLICGMPRAVQSVGTMRGEVVERCNTQFLFDDPALMITATSGVIRQQGRPFTHAYEIYLERATLLFDSGGVAGDPAAAMPVTVLGDNGRVVRPKLGPGDPCDAFVAELKEAAAAIRSNRPSRLLAGELACDAVTLCQRQTESVRRGRAVGVGRRASR